MDQDVINLAKAIRERESKGNYNAVGDAGTSHGGYQWQPDTWKAHAKAILGNENAEMTPDNQNAVAYGIILKDKQAGLNPAQIAAKWNSGKPDGWENKIGTTTINGQKVNYNVPQYVKDVTDIYQGYKNKSSSAPIPEPTQSQIADQQSGDKYHAAFPLSETDNAATSALKTVGNIPTSAFHFVKGAVDLVNPFSTAKKIGQIGSQFKALAQESGGAGNALKQTILGLPGAGYETVVPEAARGIVTATGGAFSGNNQKIDEGINTARRAVTNDPVGSILPFLVGAKGGAKVLDNVETKATMSDYVKNIGDNYKKPIPEPTTKYSDFVDSAVSKTASVVTKPLRTVFGKAGETVGNTAKFGVGQVTGLNPETIDTVAENPTAFTKKAMRTTDRVGLGRTVQSQLSKRLEEVSDTGKEYAPIRESKTPISVNTKYLQDSITETTGLTFKKGKLLSNGEARIRDAKDLRALQTHYDAWAPEFKKGYLTPKEFLNYRSDLSKLSKFEREIGKSADVENVSKELRAKLNTAFQKKIPGLKELDAKFSPLKEQYKILSKGLVDRDGNITPAAVDRIANSTGNTFAKGELLKRLEEVSPGITRQIKILKAVDDIARASGIKVGTYARGGIVAAGAFAGGPIGLIVNAILTSPELAVPIIRRYGIIKNSNAIQAVMSGLKVAATKANQLPETTPKAIQSGAFSPREKIGSPSGR